MKYRIKITYPNGAESTLTHKGKTAWSLPTAKRYLAQWTAQHGTGHKVTAAILPEDGEEPSLVEVQRTLNTLRRLDEVIGTKGASMEWWAGPEGVRYKTDAAALRRAIKFIAREYQLA